MYTAEGKERRTLEAFKIENKYTKKRRPKENKEVQQTKKTNYK